MEKAKKRIEKIINTLFNGTISPVSWLMTFLGIVAVRLFLDKFVAKGNLPAIQIEMDLHNFLFFGLTFLLVWAFLSLLLKTKPFKLAFLMICASLVIDWPPIFDMIKTGGEVYWGPYLFSSLAQLKLQYLTIFGHLPSGMMYFGTRITFIIAILALSGLVFVKTKSYLKAILSLIGTYSVLFFMASFPTCLTFAYYFLEGSKKVAEIKPFEIAQFLGFAPIFGTGPENFSYSAVYNLSLVYFPLILAILALFFFISEREKFVAVVKNLRLPQVIFHLGLFFCGIGLGILAYPSNLAINLFSLSAVLCLAISIVLAWKASVVVNDIYDYPVDNISSPGRPLQKGIFSVREYAEFGIICFVLSLLGGMTVGFKFSALLFAYQIIAFFYSAPPFRLKKFPVIASLTSAVALMTVLFLGFTLVSGEKDMEGLSWRIIFLLMIAYTLCIPIKDFKDLEGDKKNSVWTIPAIFGEDKARLIIAIGFFASYMLSVFFLNEFRLFWWALLFGGASFFVIQNKNIKAWKLIWWNLIILFFFALVLIKVVFMKSIL